jgi:ABC-type multidrug transport system ATPase subunit
MTIDDPALHLDGLSKHYGERPALHPLTLTVQPGERIVLIGHNGSGKTTLMRMIAGLLDPSDGTAQVCGFDAGSISARRRLCWLSDTPVFYDDLSVNEHLQFVAGMHAVSGWRGRADELLDAFGLTDRADDLPATFSRGLRQKAAIVLAMIRPFEVLLVDEPFVGLDAAGKQALIALMDEVHERGACQVVATHELSFVERADRVLALRDGSLIFDGRPDDAAVGDLVLPT